MPLLEFPVASVHNSAVRNAWAVGDAVRADPLSPRMKAVENRALARNLVEWILSKPRTYEEVMSAWRTSCPRLPIWEDAVDHGFVRVYMDPDHPRLLVAVTDTGRAFLAERHR